MGDSGIICPVFSVMSFGEVERTGVFTFPTFGRLHKHSGHFHTFVCSIKLSLRSHIPGHIYLCMFRTVVALVLVLCYYIKRIFASQI